MKPKKKLNKEKPQWKKVLLYIYNDNSMMKPFISGKNFFMPKIGKHYVAKDLDITNEELHIALKFLMKHDLIKRFKLGRKSFDEELDFADLTEKGFNIATEMEKELRQRKVSILILLFTFVMAVGAAVSILEYLIFVLGIDSTGMQILLLIVIIGCFFLWINEVGSFEP